MPDRWFRLLFLAAGLGAALLAIAGCGDDETTAAGPAKLTGTCDECHGNAEMLQATADPDTQPPPADAGEG